MRITDRPDSGCSACGKWANYGVRQVSRLQESLSSTWSRSSWERKLRLQGKWRTCCQVSMVVEFRSRSIIAVDWKSVANFWTSNHCTIRLRESSAKGDLSTSTRCLWGSKIDPLVVPPFQPSATSHLQPCRWHGARHHACSRWMCPALFFFDI
jgi:hypothetical protein